MSRGRQNAKYYEAPAWAYAHFAERYRNKEEYDTEAIDIAVMMLFDFVQSSSKPSFKGGCPNDLRTKLIYFCLITGFLKYSDLRKKSDRPRNYSRILPAVEFRILNEDEIEENLVA